MFSKKILISFLLLAFAFSKSPTPTYADSSCSLLGHCLCTITVDNLHPAYGTNVTENITITFNPGISSDLENWRLYMNPSTPPVANSQVLNFTDFPGGIDSYGVSTFSSHVRQAADTLASHTYTINATWNASTQNADIWYPQFSNDLNDGCLAQTPITFVAPLKSLKPAQVWVSKSELNPGVKLDLKADVYINNTLVTSGQVNKIDVGRNGFQGATLVTVPFDPFPEINVNAGQELRLVLSVRNACKGSPPKSSTATLWFNDVTAKSKFGTNIGNGTTDYFLRGNPLFLANSVGSDPRLFLSVDAGSRCSEFKQFGSWPVNL